MIIANILVLFFLELALSVETATVLALQVRSLPGNARWSALTCGIGVSLGMRVLVLCALVALFQCIPMLTTVTAGVFLVYVALHHFLRAPCTHRIAVSFERFGKVVALVEATSILLSYPSLFAVVGISREPRVIVAVGVAGIIATRLLAGTGLKVLARFPGLESSGYAMAGVIGIKLISENQAGLMALWSPPFWAFWGAMSLCVAWGLLHRPPKLADEKKLKAAVDASIDRLSEMQVTRKDIEKELVACYLAGFEAGA